jgi:hypothetical protein
MYRRPSLRSSFNLHGRRRPPLFGIASGLIVASVVGAAALSAQYQTAEPTTTRVTVVDKERQYKDGESKYIVFTDKEVFENTDSILRRKMNSSDMQGQLHVGCTYDITAYGFRSNWLSIYRNITQVEHVKTETCPENKPPMPGRGMS